MDRQFATFSLDGEQFGLDILLVKEINRQLDITEVAGAPDYIRGVLNLRGQIVTVMDLAARFGRPRREVTATSRCIVLKTSAELARHHEGGLLDDTGPDIVGILVDGIGDMLSVHEGGVAPPPAHLDPVEGRYVTGVVRLDDQLIMILAVREILGTSAA